MADCTQTPFQKPSYRIILFRVAEAAASSIQPSIVNTLVSLAIARTDPSDPERKAKRKEGRETRAERVNRDHLPCC